MHEATTTALALAREALQALTYESAVRRRTMTSGAPARAAARLALRRVIAQMEVERAEEMVAEAAVGDSRPRLYLAEGALQTAQRDLDRAEADVRAGGVQPGAGGARARAGARVDGPEERTAGGGAGVAW
jgi:hypothetical protein